MTGGDSDKGLGTFGASLGSGQHRFWFVPSERYSQEELFDRVSGILLREIGNSFLVRALYLYPASDVDDTERFTLLLGSQGTESHSRSEDEEYERMLDEYARLTLSVVSQLGDLGEDHWPQPGG